MTTLSLGLKSWPAWSGWGICPQTGALYDHCGNSYPTDEIAAAFMVWRAFKIRDSVWTPDSRPAIVDRYGKHTP